MRSFTCLLVALCVSASLLYAQDQAKLSPAQQEVLKVRDALRETALRRDMSAWSRYVSEDCIFSTDEAERSQRGFLLENSLGMPLDLDALARDVIRPTFRASGLEWKGYYAGRRGSETEMNRYTNGNSQITSHHFGHTKAVADAHYIKALPEETKIAALALDSTLRETIGRLATRAGSNVN